jgi:hypothetical protein
MGIAVFFMTAKIVQTDRFWIAAVTGLLLIPLPIRLSKEPLIFPARWPGLALFMELVANAAFAVFFLRLRWRGLATIVVASSFILVVLAGTYGNLNLGWDVPNFGADFRPRAFRSCRNIAAPAPAGGIRTLWLDYVGRAGIVALALPIPTADHAKYDLFFVLLLAPATVAAGAGLRLSGLPARLAQICGEVSYPSTSFTCRS